MKFLTPASRNPIDALKVVGKPSTRIEGKLKTTGTATYTYEHHAAAPNAAYGYVVGAGIAKGRIASIDLAQARAAPGVLDIVTADNAGTLGVGKFYVARALAGPEIDHYHQAVALVIAETFEQARAAAQLVRVQYVRTKGSFSLRDEIGNAPAPAPAQRASMESGAGDFDTAFAAAPVKLDQTYTTPDHGHVMMEPHAAIASWKGDQLTLWNAIQLVSWGLRDLALTLGIPRANIRIVAPYVGGGFGGKGSVMADAVLAALGARLVKRPVKVTLQRHLMFNNTTHRPATIQRIRLGATTDGRLTAIGHESWSGNLGTRPESSTIPTRLLYAAANRMTRLRVAHLDLPEGNAMRAPGETPGLMALEVAMDELAEQLGLDPVQLRILNDTQVDPESPERPFSTRQLVQCLETGAARFGWDRRNARPGARRDGHWLVGIGMAAGIRGGRAMTSAARVRLDRKGHVTVETDMTDIGTGSYTIIAQTAAEMLGVGLGDVTVLLGDSAYPESAGSGGQFGAASCTAGVYAACVKLRTLVAGRLEMVGADVEFVGGRVRAGGTSRQLRDAAAGGALVAEDVMEIGELGEQYAQQTFAAHFAEVAVHAGTGEIRVRRMLAVCAAGRIINPTTARSQIIGGMTMGVGAALMEDLVIDKQVGFFVNHDMAGYEVPVHADITEQDVVFLDEVDPTVGPLKAKGVGELGISGAPAALANAVYNATGIRVRKYPITLDKLLAQLPAMT